MNSGFSFKKHFSLPIIFMGRVACVWQLQEQAIEIGLSFNYLNISY